MAAAVVALGGHASMTDVHRWEVGKGGAYPKNLEALAQVLGLTVKQLVGNQVD